MSGRCAPFRLKFGCAIDLRWNLDYFRGLVERLPSGFTGDPLQHQRDRLAVSANGFQERVNFGLIALCHGGQGIEGEQNLVSLFFG